MDLSLNQVSIYNIINDCIWDKLVHIVTRWDNMGWQLLNKAAGGQSSHVERTLWIAQG